MDLREKFIELIKEHQDLTPEKAFELAGIEVKKAKTTKKARR